MSDSRPGGDRTRPGRPLDFLDGAVGLSLEAASTLSASSLSGSRLPGRCGRKDFIAREGLYPQSLKPGSANVDREARCQPR